MKLYGKRFLKRNVENRIARASETKDAILWYVNPTNKLCHVRVQGSSTDIVAYYPENWQKTPSWLKVGNAVKIMHTGGIRGRVEIVGNGLVIPTPLVTGSAPPTTIPPDCILTGCEIVPSYNAPQMAVLVKTGTFRIGGVVYSLGPIACNSDVYKASMGGRSGTIAGALAVPAAPAVSGKFRYDAVEVGTDGVLHYRSGTEFTDTPVFPAISADHVRVGNHILTYRGCQAITSANIGSSSSLPIPACLDISADPSELEDGVLESLITVAIKDQYGNAISLSSPYVLTAEISNDDDGTLAGDGAPAATAQRTGIFISTTFTYKRGTTDFALIDFTLHTDLAITRSIVIICYSS